MPQPSSHSRPLVRIVIALFLLLVTGFCVFGFLAAGELAQAAERLPWQVGYAIFGLASLSGVAAVLRLRSASTSRIHE